MFLRLSMLGFLNVFKCFQIDYAWVFKYFLNVSQIEYAWVSQETLIAASDLESAPMQYDLKMTHNIPDPWSMQVGESFVLEFTITNTNPVTSLEFDIGEMLGHPDSLTFGRPAVSFGNAYRHDDPIETAEDEGKLIHLDPLPSSTGTSSVSFTLEIGTSFSGLSVQRRKFRVLALLNTEATRDAANADNQVKILV